MFRNHVRLQKVPIYERITQPLNNPHMMMTTQDDVLIDGTVCIPTVRLADPYMRVYSSASDTPMSALYRACLLCISTYGAIPTTLYIHSSLEQPLAEEIDSTLRQVYTKQFYFYAGNSAVEQVDVLAHTEMPRWLGDSIGWTYVQNMVIAVFKQGTTNERRRPQTKKNWLV